MTFYKGVEQLPPFDDYSMKNRTYRYFEGQPLYPFGYGLNLPELLEVCLQQSEALCDHIEGGRFAQR